MSDEVKRWPTRDELEAMSVAERSQYVREHAAVAVAALPTRMSEHTVGRIRRDGGWDRRFGKRGTPRVIQALPVGPADTRIPAVRLANYALAAFAVWLAIGVWVLSLLMEGRAS